MLKKPTTQFSIFLHIEQDDIRARVKLLYENATAGILITIVTFTVLVFGIAADFDTGEQGIYLPLFTWLAMLFVCIARFIDVKKTNRIFDKKLSKQDTHDAVNTSNNNLFEAAAKRFALGLLSTCFLWALFCILFMRDMSLIELSLCAVSLSALAGGATTVLGPSRILVSIYISVMLLPYSIMGFFIDIESFHLISLMGIAFWVTMIVSAKKSSEFVSKTVSLQKSNAQLLAQVEIEKDKIEKSYTELSHANAKLDEYSNHLEKEVKRRTAQIVRMSNIDPLTELLNRKAFLDELQQRVQTAQETNVQYAVFFIDLNGFKEINDSYGHSYGDKVLTAISRRLSRYDLNERPHNSENGVVARWGGDEFVVVSEFTSKENIKTLAEQINVLVQQDIKVGMSRFSLTASIGVALYPQHAMQPEELIQRADLAMYHAKYTQQKQAVIYTDVLNQEYSRVLHLKNGLSQALNNSEFSLVYQPILNIKTDKIFGYEVLLRWKHNGQMIGPDEFVPLAEQTKQIVPIGYWVLETAIKEFCQLENYENLHLSVNISRAQLIEDDFINKVALIIASSKIKIEQLHFEITETFAVDNQEHFVNSVQKLSNSGAKISLDDFGTGFSSLEQLQAFHFAAVKIDRSFVNRLNEKDQAILIAAQFIANNFDAITIVEGVEEQAQLNILRELGFSYVQGYFYAKPMAIEEMLVWHKDYPCKKETSDTSTRFSTTRE